MANPLGNRRDTAIRRRLGSGEKSGSVFGNLVRRSVGGVLVGGVSTGDSAARSIEPGQGMTVISFYVTLVASQTDAQMLRPGVATASSVPMPFRGSILGMSFTNATGAPTNVTGFTVFVNGTSSGATLAPTLQRDYTAWPKGTYGFSKGDYLDVRYTTGSGSSTFACEVDVFVLLDQSDVT